MKRQDTTPPATRTAATTAACRSRIGRSRCRRSRTSPRPRPCRTRRVAQVRRAQEGVRPLSSRRSRSPRRGVHRPRRRSQRCRGVRRRIVAGRLERQQQPATPSVTPAPSIDSSASSRRQFAGRSPDWTIAAPRSRRRRSRRTGPRRATGPRAALHPDPGLRDHAEDALGAQPQPVRRRPGARRRHPCRLGDADRRHHPDRLHQVVDVGVAGGVVPAGPGRDPAAEGGELEALREVPQGQPVRPQPSSMDGPRVPPRTRATRLTSSTSTTPAGRAGPGSAPAGTGRGTRPRRRPTCRRRTARPPPRPARPSRAARPRPPRWPGGPPGPGRSARSPAQRADHVAEGLAVRVAGPLVERPLCTDGPRRRPAVPLVGSARSATDGTGVSSPSSGSSRSDPAGERAISSPSHRRVGPAPAPPRARSAHGGQASVATSVTPAWCGIRTGFAPNQ